MQNRLNDLIRFYALLNRLEQLTSGPFYLSNFTTRTTLPRRGVYFFMEPHEIRTDSGTGLRVVRVGTHGLKPGAKSTLSQRLSQHRGTQLTGGGHHRGSIFRLLVGTAIKHKHPECKTWGQGKSAKGVIRISETPMEKEVSAVIGRMPFLFLGIDDAASPSSQRGIVEKNTIALLSNFQKLPLDPPTPNWLGYGCDRDKVKKSGLWNQDHVDKPYDPSFLMEMENLINKMGDTL